MGRCKRLSQFIFLNRSNNDGSKGQSNDGYGKTRRRCKIRGGLERAGDEKQETQAFWLALLQKVYGVEEPEKWIAFEVPVKLDHTSFIDGLIAETRVLIEQKGQDIDLKKAYKQSDGSLLTPYQQARRYAGYLPHDRNPRWIVVCNFREFQIHDMNRPNDEPEVLKLENLEKEYHRLALLVDMGNAQIKKEMEISLWGIRPLWDTHTSHRSKSKIYRQLISRLEKILIM